MGRRKKKILLDVLDDVLDVARAPAAQRRRQPTPVAAKPLHEREFRISFGLAGAIIVFFLVSLTVSFYLGHGSGAVAGDPADGPRLRRDTIAIESQGDFAVRAASTDYTRFDRKQGDAIMEEYSRFVADRLGDIDGLLESMFILDIVDGNDPNSGKLVLEVGRGTIESMRKFAQRLRRLDYHGSAKVFGSAHAVKSQ